MANKPQNSEAVKETYLVCMPHTLILNSELPTFDFTRNFVLHGIFRFD